MSTPHPIEEIEKTLVRLSLYCEYLTEKLSETGQVTVSYLDFEQNWVPSFLKKMEEVSKAQTLRFKDE